MTRYPTQSHYILTLNPQNSPHPIIIMSSTWLANDKYQIYKSLVSVDWKPNSRYLTQEARALPTRPPRPAVSHSRGEAESESRRQTNLRMNSDLELPRVRLVVNRVLQKDASVRVH